MVEKIRETEDLFPGVLGNPVTFAVRWGLPLSRGYLRHLRRRNGVNGRRTLGRKRQLAGQRP